MYQDGTGMKRLTFSSVIKRDPAWSASGNKILFSGGTPKLHLYVINADGTGLSPLTTGAYKDIHPEWNPTSDGYVFASDRKSAGGYPDLFRRALDGSGLQRLTFGPLSNQMPSWSNALNRLVFSSSRHGDWSLFTMKPDGSDVKRLTAIAPGADYHPSWGPDGERVVFSSNRKDGRFQLYSVKADGTDMKRLTNNLKNDFDPCWHQK
jgi:Tol biopolymer transport system component